jgi:hypothetical protein
MSEAGGTRLPLVIESNPTLDDYVEYSLALRHCRPSPEVRIFCTSRFWRSSRLRWGSGLARLRVPRS